MTMLWFALTVAGVVCWGWEQRHCVMVLEEAQRPVLTPARTLWLCGVSHHLFHLQAGVCSLLHHSPSFSICNQLHNFGYLALCWTSSCSVGFGGSKPFLLWVEGLPCIPPGLGAPSLLWGLVTYLIPGSGASCSAASSSLITPASAVILLPLCQSETRKLL